MRNTLSKMSNAVEGAFYFDIGLPAKSGVGGGIIVVIPGVMGVCTFSPRLDRFNNSVRGTLFCRGLSERFNFHPYAYDTDTDVLSLKKTGKQQSVEVKRRSKNLKLIMTTSEGIRSTETTATSPDCK